MDFNKIIHIMFIVGGITLVMIGVIIGGILHV